MTNVSVIRHWLGAHIECECGYQTSHYMFTAAAVNMAHTHAYQTGHMPTTPLIMAGVL